MLAFPSSKEDNGDIGSGGEVHRARTKTTKSAVTSRDGRVCALAKAGSVVASPCGRETGRALIPPAGPGHGSKLSHTGGTWRCRGSSGGGLWVAG